MDPFSITAGVVGTAGVALHSARRVKDFIDGIRGAPRVVSQLSKDLHALQNVLETLNTFVNQVHQSGDAARTEFVLLLKPPLENCTTITESILLTVKPYTKPSGEPKNSKWRGFVWTFREREVLALQKTLLDYKMSLDIAISVANLTANLTSLNGLSDIQKSINGMRQRLEEDQESTADPSFLGSAAVGSDHGYALKRYLLETETVLGDLPSSPTAVSEPNLLSSDQGGQPSKLPRGLGSDSDDEPRVDEYALRRYVLEETVFEDLPSSPTAASEPDLPFSDQGGRPSKLPRSLEADHDDEPRVDSDDVAAVALVRTIGDGKRGYLPAEHTGTFLDSFYKLKEFIASEPNVSTFGDTVGIEAPVPKLALSPPFDQQESSADPWQEAPNLGGHASTPRPYVPPGLPPPLIPMPPSLAEVAHRITPTARDTHVPNEQDQPEHIKAWRSYFLGAPPTPSPTRTARAETVDATSWTARDWNIWVRAGGRRR